MDPPEETNMIVGFSDKLSGEHISTIELPKSRLGDKLWEEVGKAIQLLLENDYACTVDMDEGECVVINYAWNNAEFGGPAPVWLDGDALDVFYTWESTNDPED